MPYRPALIALMMSLAGCSAGSNQFVEPATARSTLDDLLEDERNTIEVFQAAARSVVHIENRALRRDWFTASVTEVPQGTGTGFVWDTNGHIVTNYHVVKGATSVHVTLWDGSTHTGTLVGAEPSKDLAVIRIDAPEAALTALTPGSSSGLLVGQKVLAIGNPFGLDQTLTTGVVSALGREIDALDGRTIHGVIQTDAAINPGNSGGPLLDSRGRLIGVNTSIFSTSGASAGIGFAIPADTVTRIVPALIKDGRIIRAGLGVDLIRDDIARRNGVEGVILRAVGTGSAASKAGLVGLWTDRNGATQIGDVIVAIEDAPVREVDDLLTALERFTPGTSVSLTVRRGDEERVVPVKLQAIDPGAPDGR
jgi:S1-C subfamily serine protease